LGITGSNDIKVVVCDPRLMQRFVKLADKLGLIYSVPKEVGVKISAEIIIIDDECLEHYEIDSKVAYLVTSNNVENIVSEVAGVKGAAVLMVGVDLGASIAYAVFADKELVSTGKVHRHEDFFRILKELISFIEPHKVIIKIGLSETKDLDKDLNEIIKRSSRAGYVVCLVDESKTTTEPPRITLRKHSVKDDDILAAINIALRDGLRILPKKVRTY